VVLIVLCAAQLRDGVALSRVARAYGGSVATALKTMSRLVPTTKRRHKQ